MGVDPVHQARRSAGRPRCRRAGSIMDISEASLSVMPALLISGRQPARQQVEDQQAHEEAEPDQQGAGTRPPAGRAAAPASPWAWHDAGIGGAAEIGLGGDLVEHRGDLFSGSVLEHQETHRLRQRQPRAREPGPAAGCRRAAGPTPSHTADDLAAARPPNAEPRVKPQNIRVVRNDRRFSRAELRGQRDRVGHRTAESRCR